MSRSRNTAEGVRSTARFADLLKEHRLAAGYSQEHLAERARISVTAIGALERGIRRAPYRATVDLLAQALGLSPGDHAELERVAAGARARGGDKAEPAREPRSNLPIPLTSFVGRTKEIADIGTLLKRNRLLTITGSGGIGKTRTALEAATRLLGSRREDIWFVDLAPVHSGALIAGKIASVVEPRLPDRGDSIDGIADALKPRELLLLLDNCEHVIEAVASIAHAILQKSPGIRILATSRERLGIMGEAVYRLSSLGVPDKIPLDFENARTFGAIELFLERCAAIDPGFAFTAAHLTTVADICRRLDGLPLAIELAAARLPTLGIATLRQRLKERFVLTGGSRDLPARQQTMLATIAWSYNLLRESERLLLNRIAVFSGGTTLEAAEAVCSDDRVAATLIPDLLGSLVDKSLVNVARNGDAVRYTLFDSVRTFALDRLSADGDITNFARRHAQWFAAVADRADASYLKMPLDAALNAVWPDFDNVRAALEWSAASDVADDVVLGGRIAGGLRALWILPGRFIECRRWVEPALERIDEAQHPHVVARLLRALIQSTNGAAVPAVAERAAPLFERIGDRRGLASLYTYLAYSETRRGRLDEAQHSVDRAAAILREEAMEQTLPYAAFCNVHALLLGARGRFGEARAEFTRAHDLASSLGDHFTATMVVSLFRAEVEFAAGEIELAAKIAEDVAASRLASAADGMASLDSLACLAAFRLALNDIDGAEAAARDLLERAGKSRPLTLELLAAVRALRGWPESAARLLGFVETAIAKRGLYRTTVAQRTHDILRAALRERLTEETLATLKAEGANFTEDRAFDEVG